MDCPWLFKVRRKCQRWQKWKFVNHAVVTSVLLWPGSGAGSPPDPGLGTDTTLSRTRFHRVTSVSRWPAGWDACWGSGGGVWRLLTPPSGQGGKGFPPHRCLWMTGPEFWVRILKKKQLLVVYIKFKRNSKALQLLEHCRTIMILILISDRSQAAFPVDITLLDLLLLLLFSLKH